MPPAVHTLRPHERLKRRKAIDELFAEGRSFMAPPVRVVWRTVPAPCEPLQAGFTASKRNFRKAADRNRVKRLLREAWRLNKHWLLQQIPPEGPGLQVFLMYTDRSLPTFELVQEKVRYAIRRLAKMREDKA